MKTCRKCGIPKPIEEFGIDKRAKDGHQWQCAQCCRDYFKAHYNHNQARRHGISVQQYEEMFVAQGGLCACCGGEETQRYGDQLKKLALDHDHACCPGSRSCGSCIRALLCSRCNTMLGWANEDPEVLRQGIIYLQTPRSPV